MPHPPTAEQIKRARIDAGWTQRQLTAHLLKLTPAEIELVSRFSSMFVTVQRWEQGLHPPSPVYAKLLRDTLDLDAP